MKIQKYTKTTKFGEVEILLINYTRNLRWQ